MCNISANDFFFSITEQNLSRVVETYDNTGDVYVNDTISYSFKHFMFDKCGFESYRLLFLGIQFVCLCLIKDTW